jgi:hypothetical protein
MVTQIPVPPTAKARSTLDRIDYADAWLVDLGSVTERTAEEWARLVLEDAKVSNSLLTGWSSLGLKLDRSGSAQTILGWTIRESTPDHVLLAAGGRLGLSGELLFERRESRLHFSTFVRLGHPAARGLWAAIEPAHVRIVRGILEDAAAKAP